MKPTSKGEIPVGDEQLPTPAEEREKRYLECLGLRCPYCDSPIIYAEGWNGDTSTQDVTCENCGKHWKDCYELTGIIEDE